MTIIIQKYFDEFKRLYVKHEANIVTDEEKRPHWEHTQKKNGGVGQSISITSVVIDLRRQQIGSIKRNLCRNIC